MDWSAFSKKYRVQRSARSVVWLLMSSALLASTACDGEGIGEPCIPELEYEPGFGGFSRDEVNVESRSFQCETRLCLVNKFQGRVSCPYGQGEGGQCRTPDGAEPVAVVVPAQLVDRPARDAVYCSCRCNGPDVDAPYCECPEGYECADLLPELELGQSQMPGGYCVRSGTDVDSNQLEDTLCDRETASCDG